MVKQHHNHILSLTLKVKTYETQIWLANFVQNIAS